MVDHDSCREDDCVFLIFFACREVGVVALRGRKVERRCLVDSPPVWEELDRLNEMWI